MISQVDIIIHLESFRNIDVFLQGLYYIQIRLSGDAVPYYNEASSITKKFHDLYPPQIIENIYASKIFLLKYAEEVVKILETVVFRVEIDPSSNVIEPISMIFELMFTDLKGDLSPNSVQNYLKSPPAESLFTKVGEVSFTISNLLSGVNQTIFVTFLDTFSSSLLTTVHIFLTNYKIPENYIEVLFPDSAEYILESKIDQAYDTYLLPMALGYNLLCKAFRESSLLIKLPLLYNSEIEPDFVHNTVSRVLFSKCLMTRKKSLAADAIISEIQETTAAVQTLKHEFLEAIMKNSENIINQLLSNYISLMDDRWGENIIQEILQEEPTIITNTKSFSEDVEIAQRLKASNNFANLTYFDITDDRLFLKPENNTILFESIYCKEIINNPTLPELLNSRSKTRHLIVLVHGYLGSYIDVKMLQDTISNVYPKGLFLLSRANEGQTNGSIPEMGHRLAEELKTYIKNSSSIFIEKISFVGHSLGGLIIRACLPHLLYIKDKCYSYISLACPHLGCLNNQSKLIDTGLWLLSKLKQSQLLNQLILNDTSNTRNSVIYNLSKEPGLEWFKKVYFFSSSQDSYVPYHSARIEAGANIAHGDTLEYEIAHNIISNITGSIHRINTIFPINTMEMSDLIGRSAHIMFLDNLQFLNILVFKYIL